MLEFEIGVLKVLAGGRPEPWTHCSPACWDHSWILPGHFLQADLSAWTCPGTPAFDDPGLVQRPGRNPPLARVTGAQNSGPNKEEREEREVQKKRRAEQRKQGRLREGWNQRVGVGRARPELGYWASSG